MALIVQKYGGTSVGSVERINNVAARVGRHREQGHRLVVVVSAMSGATDSLINIAREILPLPPGREMDMLLSTGEQIAIALTAMALQARGIPAVALTGAQAGIITDDVHTKARISEIDPGRIRELLDTGHVVVVAGFQGQTPGGHVTTLGRGGSDLTAIALAAVLEADRCQIFTDVDGIYTADPRLVSDARKLVEVSYEEMLELAGSGAKVMQLRSIELAKKLGVIFEVRSSMNDNPGTTVKTSTTSIEDAVIRGVSIDKNQVKITLLDVPDRPGMVAHIFRTLAAAAVDIDMITQTASSRPGRASKDVSFTLDRADLSRARKVLDEITPSIAYRDLDDSLTNDNQIAKLSIVGGGIRGHSGVASRMFGALAEHGIDIDLISTSEVKISVVVDAARGDDALKILHAAFFG